MKKLNLGCGTQIKKGGVNVDIQKAKEIDKSFDFNKVPYPFNVNTFDYILIDNVLEHLDDVDQVMQELYRIAKKDAIIEIIVPYYNSFYSHSDYTHKHHFTEKSFEFICFQSYRHEQNEKFKIDKLNLVPQRFIKYLPMPILKFLSRGLNNIFVNIEVKMKVIKSD